MNALTCAEVRELAAAYVLDGLEPSVAAAVCEHLAGHATSHPEFAELGSVAPALAYLSDPVSPPAALKERILAAAAATAQEPPVHERAARGAAAYEATARPVPARAGVAPDHGPREVQPTRPQLGWREAITAGRFGIARWAFAAAAIVAIGALVFADASLQRDVSNAREFGDQLHRAVALAAAPGSRIAVIGPSGGTSGSAGSGIPAGPNGLAVIPASGPGVLVMQGLGATDGSQVYEAWSIVGSGAPLPIGSFGVGGDGLGWLTELAVPSGGDVVVALTREPGPGATTPTLPIVAMGKAAPPAT
jgi:hypothetical protein